MKIAQIAPLAEAVPPKLYGGTERVVSYMTEELVTLGHDVTLFASGDSKTSAKLAPMSESALRLNPTIRDHVAPHIVMIEKVLERSHEFDVIHVHIDHLHVSAFRHLGLPFLTTLHGRLDLPELVPLFRMLTDAPFVSISNSQRRPLPYANWLGTVYHGLPKDLHTLSERPREYLAFLGRISPEKAPDSAIRIARTAGLPLRIAAKVDRVDQEYFESVVRPMLNDPDVEYIGEIGEDQKSEFLGGAKALLFPINWPEPFGLSLIEAMACGTPVVAFRRGSVSELVQEGVTGFVVEDEAGAVEAVGKIGQVDHRRIRRRFEERFTSRRMALEYLELYRSVAATARSRAPALQLVAGE